MPWVNKVGTYLGAGGFIPNRNRLVAWEWGADWKRLPWNSDQSKRMSLASFGHGPPGATAREKRARAGPMWRSDQTSVVSRPPTSYKTMSPVVFSLDVFKSPAFPSLQLPKPPIHHQPSFLVIIRPACRLPKASHPEDATHSSFFSLRDCLHLDDVLCNAQSRQPRDFLRGHVLVSRETRPRKQTLRLSLCCLHRDTLGNQRPPRNTRVRVKAESWVCSIP